jgi:hypothetical protein
MILINLGDIMQEGNSVSLGVEYILIELSRCVNDLKSNLKQLESLISFVKES